MKKNILFAIVLVLCLFAMTACGAPDNQDEESNQGEIPSSFDDSPIETTLLQGGPSGVWFMLSNGISECLNTSYPGSILDITPGQNQSNIQRLCAGEAEFVLSHNHVAIAENIQVSAGNKSTEVLGVAAFYTSPAQMVVTEDQGITSFDEIINEKLPLTISIGPNGNVHEEVFNQLISLYGLSIQDMEQWGFEVVYKTLDESEQMLMDGTIDGYFFFIGAPTLIIVENATNLDLAMVELDADRVSQLCEEYGYIKDTIPAGTYNFLDEDYATFSDYTILATTLDVSDEVVYKITKSIYENLEYLSAVHATLKNINAQTMIEELKVSIHPGALQYFKDAGLAE